MNMHAHLPIAVAKPNRPPLRPVKIDKIERPSNQIEKINQAVEAIPMRRAARIRDVIQVVCIGYGVSITDIKSDKRPGFLTLPRRVGYYLASALTLHSFARIGREFNRDHATVMSGSITVSRQLKVDAVLRSDINICVDAILSRIEGKNIPIGPPPLLSNVVIDWILSAHASGQSVDEIASESGRSLALIERIVFRAERLGADA